jgi:MiaB/RimO family radical SAM methylthiotransferase
VERNLYRTEDGNIFYIKISTGCVGTCSYCGVRLSRGVIRSKKVEDIMEEFRRGLDQGFSEFALMGTDLGPFGLDRKVRLTDLLSEMLSIDGDYRIGLRNAHPRFVQRMLPDLIPLLSTGKIWYMGIAVESGSDPILKLMKRGYSVDDVREVVTAVKKACPDITLRTQMMVGFPSEGWSDFKNSLRLLRELQFDYTEVYRFSPRPGTCAAEMDKQVPTSVALLRKAAMDWKANICI